MRIPLREIHPAPSFVNIVGNQPGRRCHSAIPQPHCAIGVTVIARPFKNCSHGWCQWKTRANLPRGVDRRISRRRTYDLSSHDENNEGHNHPLNPDQNVISLGTHSHCIFATPLAPLASHRTTTGLESFICSGQYKRLIRHLSTLLVIVVTVEYKSRETEFSECGPDSTSWEIPHDDNGTSQDLAERDRSHGIMSGALTGQE